MAEQRRVIICGAGGVGFYLSLALSRAGVRHDIYDDDDLQGGLGFSRMPKASSTTKKVNLLRGVTLAVFGDAAPALHDEKFNGDEADAGDIVVDCSDMPLTARKTIWERTRSRGARIIRVSYDGRNNTVVVAEGLPLAGSKAGGYVDTPSLSLSFTVGGIGAIAVQKILAGYEQHVEFQIAIDEFFPKPVTVIEEHVIVEAPARRRRHRATT